MTKTLTGRYASANAALNTHEDLIHTGFPSEKVYLDRRRAEVTVMTPDPGAREVREILSRHLPAEITENLVF